MGRGGPLPPCSPDPPFKHPPREPTLPAKALPGGIGVVLAPRTALRAAGGFAVPMDASPDVGTVHGSLPGAGLHAEGSGEVLGPQQERTEILGGARAPALGSQHAALSPGGHRQLSPEWRVTPCSRCRAVEALLKQGADPNLVLPEGIAAVHLAAGKERESGVRCLQLVLQYGGDPNAR